MRTNKYTFLSSLALTVMSSLSSCSNKEPGITEPEPDQVKLLNVEIVSHNVESRADGWTVQNGPHESEAAAKLLDEAFHTGSDSEGREPSKIYLTQYGPLNQSPELLFENDNRFEYIYKPMESVIDQTDWDHYYNFATAFPDDESGTKMLDWDHVDAVGSVGNGYWLYGFYYPFDNEPRYYVEPDQSTKEALRKSNILAAFHQAPSLRTRLRFRFYHLMVYLKVYVLVPVYQLTPEDKENTNTGFYPDALQSAQLLNTYINFGINWSKPRNSDTEGPLVTLVTSTNIAPYDEGNPVPPGWENGNLGVGGMDNPPTVQEISLDPMDINLYMHPFITADGKESPYPSEEDIVTIDNIGDYQPNMTGSDRCYLYTFSVLFPPQQFNGNFLKFSFKNPLGVVKNYNYSGANNESVTGTLQTVYQGDLQVLALYLPRKGNQAILVTADVEDWQQANASTNVNMQGKKDID
ncbi:MAG: hypothetical protein J1F38_04045 [Muribaculaceae bacterium]|nr:hypothetical protein [Muribaculaceae bacterium]